MRAGVWNLAFGFGALAAGLSGRFSLPGTQSPAALAVVGAVLAAFGLFQLLRSR